MVDAQNHIDTNYPKDNTTTRITIDWVNNQATNPKLEGKLIIKDYPELKRIDLSEHALTSLVVINCPKLEAVDVNNNYEGTDQTKSTLGEIKLEQIGVGNKLSNLSCGGSIFTEISFANLSSLETFNCPNTPSLDRLRDLDQAKKLQRVNLIGSAPISFMHEVKENYFEDTVKEVKKTLGLDPSQNLPTVDYVDPNTGKTQKKIDPAKLKTDLEKKVVSGSAEYSQLKTQKETAERERDEAKAKLESQKDYDTIKAERDQKIQDFQAIADKLGLTGQVTQEQILTKIAELMNRPTGDRVSELERKITEKDKRISELENKQKVIITKENIIEKSGESSRSIGFTISDKEKTKISRAATGLEAWKVRDEVIKEKFSELKKQKDNAFYLNIGLGSLTILCLVVSGWLIIRQTNLPKTEPEKIKN